MRKKINVSQVELSQFVNINRRTLCRYEMGERTPNDDSKHKIVDFINSKNLSTTELEEIGKKYLNIHYRVRCSNIELSSDLSEFVGIIIGDGEIKHDGEIRISFNPANEYEYLYARIFPLVKKFIGKEPSFESEKRIRTQSRSFQLFLKSSCQINSGNKYSHEIKIPDWCFKNRDYLCSILRGLFDSDGYIGYEANHNVEIMFGRFSSRALTLSNSISDGLNMLGIKNKLFVCKDGRYKVRIHNAQNAVKFFHLIGSSNYKHILRFLMWHLTDKNIKIEKEGYLTCKEKFNNEFKRPITSIMIPYKHWCKYD
ncbi:MAG: LAGLIDADG family homing endonuclease [Candidatus Aenigmarchaeota archaeon]|nr:LAGLIDADG family homing endonuclease [Candidatus Aenigmarchaeota archaeon]